MYQFLFIGLHSFDIVSCSHMPYYLFIIVSQEALLDNERRKKLEYANMIEPNLPMAMKKDKKMTQVGKCSIGHSAFNCKLNR